jgi:S1-C subfamily serine protease
MRRTPLYSSAARPKSAEAPPAAPAAKPAAPAAVASPTPPLKPPGRLRAFADRHQRVVLLLAGAAIALAAVFAQRTLQPPGQRLTQRDIDQAVRHSLEKKPLPSIAAKAYEVVRPSVVHVRGEVEPNPHEDPADAATNGGTGVVISDKGVILTNLHVVAGAKKVTVVFSDGTESPAQLINVEPQHDLAVLKATKMPDDIMPATLRGTGDLVPGDHVMAVGFPFGIGPSVSAGVVSGLKREFRSPEGKRVLTNLIQFDAAANPGSSGGPLVTAEGEVVGIVTAILNPSEQRTFIGIGFAVPIENAAQAAGMPPF